MGERLHSGELARYGLIAAEVCSAPREWIVLAARLRRRVAKPTPEQEALWHALQKRARKNRPPARDWLLSFCLCTGASVEETQRLLRLAQSQALYPRIRRDAAILFCMQQQYSLPHCQAFLVSHGQCGLYP